MNRNHISNTFDQIAWRSLASCLMVAIAGCSVSTGDVSGKVTENGQTVRRVDLTFESLDESDLERIGGHISDEGEIKLDFRDGDGLPPGRYKITVERHVLRNGAPLPAGSAGEELKSSGQTVLQSFVFKRKIVPGDNSLRLELTEGDLIK